MQNEMRYIDLDKNEFVDTPPEEFFAYYAETPKGFTEMWPIFENFVHFNPWIAYDIETAREDGRKIVQGDAIEWDRDVVCVLSFSNGTTTFVLKVNFQKLDTFRPFIELAFTKPIVGHNVKFDLRFTKRDHDIVPPLAFDTMIAERAIHSEVGYGYGLADLCARHLKVFLPKDEQKSSWLSVILTPSQVSYAAKDTYYTAKLVDCLIPLLNENERLHTRNINSEYLKVFGVKNRLFHMEMELISVYTELEHHGFYMDVPKIEELFVESKHLENRILSKFISSVGSNCNPRSPKQVLTMLRRKYASDGVVDQYGDYRAIADLQKTGKDELKPFVGQGFDAIDHLHDYRTLMTNIKRIQEFKELVHYDERLRFSISTWGTVTGRTSCSKPNVQNIKNKERYGINLRKLFISPKDRYLIVTDYEQIQLVIIAALTRDPVMMDVIETGPEKGIDLHKMTAAAIMDIDVSEVTADIRKKAKGVNFGYCLVAGTMVLTIQGFIPIEQVKVGMRVFTHKGEWQDVEEIFTRTVKQTYLIETEKGYKAECSIDHLWMVIHNDVETWKAAGLLKPGDTLKCWETGKFFYDPIKKVTRKNRKRRVYDFRVANDHSFIANHIVSHNCFGMGAKAFVQYAYSNYDLYYTLEEAKIYRARYFNLYKEIKNWHERVKRSQVGGKFLTETFWGRRAWAGGFTDACNYPVQGTEGDIMKYAQILIHQDLKKRKLDKWASMVNMVHDEVVVEAHKDCVNEVKELVESNMSKAGNLILRNIVPVRAKGEIVTNWADGK
jgi:DNA polymerase I-like protein with 3'-5' exonuclease and polymerase domains